MFYPEAVNLPFNSSVTSALYVPAKPGEMESGEPGYWVIVQEERMVFCNREGNLSLLQGELPDNLKTGAKQTPMEKWKGSQSWPFPSQLMAAFIAEYESGEIAVDTSELEDAGWYGKDALPPTFSDKSIAGWLIKRFLAGNP